MDVWFFLWCVLDEVLLEGFEINIQLGAVCEVCQVLIICKLFEKLITKIESNVQSQKQHLDILFN